jgi:hypothetical protein
VDRRLQPAPENVTSRVDRSPEDADRIREGMARFDMQH